MKRRLPFFARVSAALLALAVFACLLAPPAVVAAPEERRAELLYQKEGGEPRRGGEAMVCGRHARLDVQLGKAGLFTLLVDGEAGKMQVLSQRLKGYVESRVEGEGRNWRELVRSASAVLMPQTLGMVSFEEKSYRELGRESVEGYEALKSRCVFSLGFMGSYRDITVDVWESEAFAPFPLKVAVLDDKSTQGGAAWLDAVQPLKEGRDAFLLPAGYTRFGSVLDLILYALSAL